MQDDLNSSFEKFSKEPPRDKNKPNKYSKTFSSGDSGNLDHIIDQDEDILHYANKAKKNSENDKPKLRLAKTAEIQSDTKPPPEKRLKKDQESSTHQKDGFQKDKISTYRPDDYNYAEWRY